MHGQRIIFLKDPNNHLYFCVSGTEVTGDSTAGVWSLVRIYQCDHVLGNCLPTVTQS